MSPQRKCREQLHSENERHCEGRWPAAEAWRAQQIGRRRDLSFCDGFTDIIRHVWIVCPNCRNRFPDAPGDLKQYSCSVCGSRNLVRVRSEQERSRDALAGLAAGAAVGAAIGELPGALIGGIIGLVLAALRTPTIEQSKK
jgi:DNA-directed RNA polymerase subunit RPC12/RpoP